MRRPALGHLLGYTALTVMLTAGAAQSLSGSNTVFSDDITPGNVRGSDLAANSVSSGKILNNTVTGADVANGSLTGADVADGSVSGGKIALDTWHAVEPADLDAPTGEDTVCADGRFCFFTAITPNLYWTNGGGDSPAARYRRNLDGLVHLTGLVRSATTGYPTSILKLPDGYRPAEPHIFVVACYKTSSPNVAFVKLTVTNDGTVRIENPESTCSPQQGFNGWLSLSGLSFPAG